MLIIWKVCSTIKILLLVAGFQTMLNKRWILFLFQLLVNNKIISLDLPVADVYKKIWCAKGEVSWAQLSFKVHTNKEFTICMCYDSL